MDEIIAIMMKQLDIEMNNAKQKLTASNLDTIYKLTESIRNLKDMQTVKSDRVPVYSNGTYEKNIDLLYERYMDAKKSYRDSGSAVQKSHLIESVGILMAEVYDMLNAMLKDCECVEEKKEIQVNIKKLSQI